MVEGLNPLNAYLERFAHLGARACIFDSEYTHTYQELGQAIDFRRIELQQSGIRPGDVVGLIGDYSFGNIALFFALASCGAILVPVAVATVTEIKERLGVAGAKFRIMLEGNALKIERTPSVVTTPPALISRLRETGHPGLILFSSGSTGRPKAMLHDLTRWLLAYRGKTLKDYRQVMVLLFDHIGGLDSMMRALVSGAGLVVPSGRDPENVAQAIVRHRASVLPASPTFLNLMLLSEVHMRYNLSSLQIIAYGAESMPEPLLRKLQAIFPEADLQQKFGTTETNAVRTRSRNSGSLFMRIDDPMAEYKIVEGELWLRSQSQILGYLNAPMDRFTAEGWFRTGDLVEEDNQGFFRVTGRVQEVINVGGEKVLPPEVEGVLLQMPEIQDCVVYGEPNAITGQAVVAEVVLRPGTQSDRFRLLVRMYARSRLATYKIPTKVKIVEKTAVNSRMKKIRRSN